MHVGWRSSSLAPTEVAMAYCGQCGSELGGGARFCGHCGSSAATGIAVEPEQRRRQPTADVHSPVGLNFTPALTPPGRLPASTLALAVGGILLIIGAMLPWVTVGALFSISGITAHYGLGTLLIGLVALVAAFGAGRVFSPRAGKFVSAITSLLGLVALAVALLVAFGIRDAIAESESGGNKSVATDTTNPITGDTELDNSLRELGESVAEAFKVSTGMGVYSTAAGGLLVLLGGVQAFRRATLDLRSQ